MSKLLRYKTTTPGLRSHFATAHSKLVEALGIPAMLRPDSVDDILTTLASRRPTFTPLYDFKRPKEGFADRLKLFWNPEEQKKTDLEQEELDGDGKSPEASQEGKKTLKPVVEESQQRETLMTTPAQQHTLPPKKNIEDLTAADFPSEFDPTVTQRLLDSLARLRKAKATNNPALAGSDYLRHLTLATYEELSRFYSHKYVNFYDASHQIGQNTFNNCFLNPLFLMSFSFYQMPYFVSKMEKASTAIELPNLELLAQFIANYSLPYSVATKPVELLFNGLEFLYYQAQKGDPKGLFSLISLLQTLIGVKERANHLPKEIGHLWGGLPGLIASYAKEDVLGLFPNSTFAPELGLSYLVVYNQLLKTFPWMELDVVQKIFNLFERRLQEAYMPGQMRFRLLEMIHAWRKVVDVSGAFQWLFLNSPFMRFVGFQQTMISEISEDIHRFNSPTRFAFDSVKGSPFSNPPGAGRNPLFLAMNLMSRLKNISGGTSSIFSRSIEEVHYTMMEMYSILNNFLSSGNRMKYPYSSDVFALASELVENNCSGTNTSAILDLINATINYKKQFWVIQTSEETFVRFLEVLQRRLVDTSFTSHFLCIGRRNIGPWDTTVAKKVANIQKSLMQTLGKMLRDRENKFNSTSISVMAHLLATCGVDPLETLQSNFEPLSHSPLWEKCESLKDHRLLLQRTVLMSSLKQAERGDGQTEKLRLRVNQSYLPNFDVQNMDLTEIHFWLSPVANLVMDPSPIRKRILLLLQQALQQRQTPDEPSSSPYTYVETRFANFRSSNIEGLQYLLLLQQQFNLRVTPEEQDAICKILETEGRRLTGREALDSLLFLISDPLNYPHLANSLLEVTSKMILGNFNPSRAEMWTVLELYIDSDLQNKMRNNRTFKRLLSYFIQHEIVLESWNAKVAMGAFFLASCQTITLRDSLTVSRLFQVLGSPTDPIISFIWSYIRQNLLLDFKDNPQLPLTIHFNAHSSGSRVQMTQMIDQAIRSIARHDLLLWMEYCVANRVFYEPLFEFWMNNRELIIGEDAEKIVPGFVTFEVPDPFALEFYTALLNGNWLDNQHYEVVMHALFNMFVLLEPGYSGIPSIPETPELQEAKQRAIDLFEYHVVVRDCWDLSFTNSANKMPFLPSFADISPLPPQSVAVQDLYFRNLGLETNLDSGQAFSVPLEIHSCPAEDYKEYFKLVVKYFLIDNLMPKCNRQISLNSMAENALMQGFGSCVKGIFTLTLNRAIKLFMHNTIKQGAAPQDSDMAVTTFWQYDQKIFLVVPEIFDVKVLESNSETPQAKYNWIFGRMYLKYFRRYMKMWNREAHAYLRRHNKAPGILISLEDFIKKVAIPVRDRMPEGKRSRLEGVLTPEAESPATEDQESRTAETPLSPQSPQIVLPEEVVVANDD